MEELDNKKEVEIQKIGDYFDQIGNIWIYPYNKEKGAWYEYYPICFREKHAFEMIDKEKRGVAVDLGCGYGHALIEMKRLGFRNVIGVDISDKMLHSVQELLIRHGLANEIKLYKADVQNLSMIESGSIDVCLALGVIEYQSSDRPLLIEINRILKPGGIAIVQIRNYDCIYDKTSRATTKILQRIQFQKIFFRRHKTKEFISEAEKYGFKVVQVAYSHFYALYPFTLIPLFRKLLWPFDNYLSKKMERFSGIRMGRWLASMCISKIQKI